MHPFCDSEGGEIKQRFDAILNGFSATITDATLNSFKSLQGDVIKYIGGCLLFSPGIPSVSDLAT